MVFILVSGLSEAILSNIWVIFGQGADIDDDDLKGLVPRITEQIFHSILTSPPHLEYLVKVSYMEIYMERIRDLLVRKYTTIICTLTVPMFIFLFSAK